MLAILGCGGHARSVADVWLDKHSGIPGTNIVFVDKNAKPNERIFGFPVVDDVKHITDSFEAIIGLGNIAERDRLYLQYPGLRYINIYAADSYLSVLSQFGKGNFVAHRAYIGPNVHIGNHNIINTGAIVEHECVIGNFCHIAPHSTLCGRTVIGDNVFIGAGATVTDYGHIADNITIGAGAVVVGELVEPGVYAGVPAKKLQ